MARRRASLDALEAEIRETRRRLGALVGRADREFGLRPGLNLLRRLAAKPAATAAAAADQPALWALPAAALAFAIGLVAARRFQRAAAPQPANPPEPAEKAGGPPSTNC
jgi:hypothetical protein